MDRKFQTLILALEMALPFEANMQEGFERFLTGRLPLRDAVGNKLNPYDYIGKTGRPLIRFTTESQEKVAERLNFVEKKTVETRQKSHPADRIARIELELTELRTELAAIRQRLCRPGKSKPQNRYPSSRTLRQDGTDSHPGYVLQIPGE